MGTPRLHRLSFSLNKNKHFRSQSLAELGWSLADFLNSRLP